MLEDLFNKRVELKAQLVSLEKKKEYLEKIISSAKERGKRILESLILKYSSICFDCDYLDLKQKALKIYINTFYGKADNSIFLIYLFELARETTSARKYNLNLVMKFISEKGFRKNMGIPILCILYAQISIMKNVIKFSSEKSFLKKRTELKWSKLL